MKSIIVLACMSTSVVKKETERERGISVQRESKKGEEGLEDLHIRLLCAPKEWYVLQNHIDISYQDLWTQTDDSFYHKKIMSLSLI